MRKAEIDDFLTAMLDSHDNVSDLNVTVDRPLQVESSGELVGVPVTPPVESLTAFQTEIFALNLINGDRRLCQFLVEQGSCDSSYWLPGKARFRVNIFTQRGNTSIVLRKLETRIPTIEELKLPDAFGKMTKEKNGLVLVCGATGSGKTTSLAALLNEFNSTRSIHIVTLEDPVEYVHPNRKATFNQRELGGDYDSFANGLRAALRQAPKIILVGEMRDRETAELALKASETGHLVLSTLHTVTAARRSTASSACSTRKSSARSASASRTRSAGSSDSVSCRKSAAGGSRCTTSSATRSARTSSSSTANRRARTSTRSRRSASRSGCRRSTRPSSAPTRRG
jgi:twitching motility protein PilT